MEINLIFFQTAMEMMGIIGVIVNVALIGQSGQVHRMFPNITANQTIILIVILEVRKAHLRIYNRWIDRPFACLKELSVPKEKII